MKIYKHRTNGSTMTYKDGCMKIDNLVVEGHPNLDYWEEVVERDYEILTYNMECRKNFDGSPTEKENSRTIISIKRLSDGEVFTVGDKVRLPESFLSRTSLANPDNTIKSFKVWPEYYRHSKLMVIILNGCHIPIDELKSEKVVFTTEDGVDIFEGDDYYEVNDYFEILEEHQSGTITYNIPTHKYFSSKKAAEEYIVYNKPCLSLNDFLEARKNVHLNIDQSEKVFDIYDYLKDIAKNRK